MNKSVGRVEEKFFRFLLITSMAIVSCPYINNYSYFQKILWMALAFFGLLFYSYKKRYSMDETYIKILGLYVVPFVFAMGYTLCIGLFRNDEIGYMKQAVTTSLFMVVDFFVVLSLICLLKERLLKNVSYMLIITFVSAVVVRVYRFGTEELRAHLELHDVGIAVVPIIMVYIFEWMINDNKKIVKQNLISIILLFIILILCAKRSAFFSIAAAIFLFFLYKCFKKKKWMLVVFSSLTYLVCFFYVFLIKSGLLDFLSNGYGTLSDRYYVWNWFGQIYDFSPLYFGQGFQYIHRYMQFGNGNGIVNDYSYLHNSILQLFIELGFWGFAIWFGIVLIGIPLYAKKKTTSNFFAFVTVSNIAMVVMYTVDNSLTYPLYTVCFLVSIYCAYFLDNCKIDK